MKKINWKKLMIAGIVLAVLVLLRAAVSMLRADYWGQDPLSSVSGDPWIYAGFIAAAVAVFAWSMIPTKKDMERLAKQAEASHKKELEERSHKKEPEPIASMDPLTMPEEE